MEQNPQKSQNNQKPIRLTEKQKKFYESLRQLMEKNGESPTVAELVRRMKLSSPRAVTQYLESLERKGLIERRRYERRGIRLKGLTGETFGYDINGTAGNVETVMIPVIASAGCDNVNVFAERWFGDFICIAPELLQGRKKDRVVCVRAVGDSMVDAGIKPGDYVLVDAVESTDLVHEGDLVVAIIDSFAVIKKIQFATNAIILHPVSPDPQYQPIILTRDFRIFGRVIDVIRVKPKDDMEIVPLLQDGPEQDRFEYRFN